MNAPIKTQLRPWMTTKEGRDHLRMCATGQHCILTMSCQSVRDLCCDVDALVFWYEEHQKVLEVLREQVEMSLTQGGPETRGKLLAESVNRILERVGMYVQPPPEPPREEPKKKRAKR